MIEQEGGQLLRTLAHSMIELGQLGRTGTITLPYPPVVQRTLDRIVSICLDVGQRPPSGVPELVAWCAERTAAQWPFPVPIDLIRPDSMLVDPVARRPTRTCLELSCGGLDGPPEQQARDLLRQLDEAASSTDGVRRSRNFLVDRPIVRDGSTTRQPEYMATWRRVRHLYNRVPAAYLAEKRVATCPSCGLLALTEGGRLTWCEAELCPRGVDASFDRVDNVWLLCDPLRIFLALPGITERRLCSALATGIGITLTDPVEGTYELGASIRGRRFVHILDRAEPALLVTAAARWPDGLIVIPQRTHDHIADYRATVESTASEAVGLALMTDDELVALAGDSRKESGHA